MTQLQLPEPDRDRGLRIAATEDLLEAFLGSLSPNTRRAYDWDLRDFSRFLGAASSQAAISQFLSAGPGMANLQALDYKTDMVDRNLAPRTIARRLSALRSVVEMGRAVAAITWSLWVKSPKITRKRDTRGPGLAGWRRMLAELRLRVCAPGQVGAKAARDLAIVRLLHDRCLRRAEVAGLDVEHIEELDGRPAALHILGKGRNERERIELATATGNALGAWLAVRGRRSGPLFVRLDRPIPNDGPPERLTAGSINRNVVADIGRRAGVERGARPHGLRHEGITQAIRLNVNVFDVSKLARHANVRTTQDYVDDYEDPTKRISELISED